MAECGAKRRGRDQLCRTPAMANGRCRLHGGLTPKGYDLPQTTHGRYSAYLPARLAGRYFEAQADGDLTSMREEIALVDARISDVLQRVDTQECGTLWRKIGKAVIDYREAEDIGDQIKAFAEIEALVEAGKTDYATWSEVLSLIESRRKIAETETKRLEKMGQMVTAERAMLLVTAIVDVIRRNVDDKEKLGAISRDIGKLVNMQGGK